MPTRSEKLFERFCSERSILFRSVAVGSEKTPDYDLEINGQLIAVEVKQLDRDEQAWSNEGKVKESCTIPGEHIRRKINRAGPQLRARAAEGYPSILVLYNNIYRIVGLFSEPYDFLVAMYGLQSIVMEVPRDGLPYMKGQRFGPRRKMTDSANTSFSALARLGEDQDERLFLDVFHNAYASAPLDPAVLRGRSIRHFTIPRGGLEFVEWDVVG